MNTAIISTANLHEIEGEPRILDTDLAFALGMAEVRKVRQNLIEPNRAELEGHGPLRMERIQTGGRPAKAYYLNEAQALLVCMFARTENAAAVRKQVIEVFVAWRRGTLGDAPVAAPSPEVASALDRLTKAYEAVGEAYAAAMHAHDALAVALLGGGYKGDLLDGLRQTAAAIEARARRYAASLAADQASGPEDVMMRERAVAELGRLGLLPLRERAELEYRLDLDRRKAKLPRVH